MYNLNENTKAKLVELINTSLDMTEHSLLNNSETLAINIFDYFNLDDLDLTTEVKENLECLLPIADNIVKKRLIKQLELDISKNNKLIDEFEAKI